jgi:hypothetical protein
VSARAQISARLPFVFALDEREAAAAIGVGLTLFKSMVQDGRMPRPRIINSRRAWDVDELRAAFKALPVEGESDTNPWD